MQPLGTDVDAADCPFCGCPVLLPAADDPSPWSCAACGAVGRRRLPDEAPLTVQPASH